MKAFQDKPALLTAVFGRNTKAVRLPDLSAGADLSSSLERLIEFDERLVAFLTRPRIVRTGRLMAANADEYPRLAAAFYAAGPGAMLKKVAAFLKLLAERGGLSIKDSDLAAEQLIVAGLGMNQLRQNLGVAGPPSAAAIAIGVRYASETLVRAWSTSAVLDGGKGHSGRTRPRRSPSRP